MKYKVINEEILYSTELAPRLSAENMEELEGMAGKTARKRVRICTHESPDSLLHEMFIVHAHDAYVRPHKHKGRDESVHVLSGLVDVIVFNESGEIEDVFEMGDYQSGKTFYCRLPMGTLHMFIVRSDILTFCEATMGPFNPNDVEFASWSPEDGSDGVWDFVAEVGKRIERMA